MYQACKVSQFVGVSNRLTTFFLTFLFFCFSTIAHATVPTIASATVPADASYGSGSNLDFTVTWSEAVDVDTGGGTPYITVTLSDASTVNASYVSGHGTDTLTFRYTTAGTEADGAIAVADSITLNGGTLLDSATSTDPADATSIPFGPTAAVLIDNTAPSVTSINRQSPAGALVNSHNLIYRVTFNEAVSGVDISDFTLTTISGVTTGTVFSINAISATTYDVTVNVDMMSSDGTIRLDLNSSGTGITDAASNPIAAGYTSGQSYTIDTVQPLVSSINRLTPASASTNAASVIYRVTFTEHVNGVGTSDFELTAGGGATGNIASVSATSGTTIDVTVDSITGEGTLRLDVSAFATITDDVGSGIGSAFTGGQTYTIDTTAPSVTSINRQTPATVLTNATSVVYRVTFDESVSGVDVSDFTVTATGTAAGSVASVSAASGTIIDVTVDTISGDGTLRLDLNGAATGIADGAGNAIGGGFASGQTYTIDTTAPSVTSINRQTPASATTNATSVVYRVTFDESVSGVDVADFTVTATGTAAGSVASVSAASGTTIDVTVDTISGDGTLRLDLNGAATGIADGAGNAIGGGYSSGQTYTIDNTAPSVSSSSRQTPATAITNATSVVFRVIFSESVTGVDTTDFSLSVTGTATGTISSVSAASGATIDVTVSSVSGDGTLALGVNGTGIADSAGNALSGGFGGQSYTIDNTAPTVVSVNRQSPVSNPTSMSDVTYRVTFSESVGGLVGADIDLIVMSGTFPLIWVDSIAAVSPDGSGNSDRWDVTVHTGGGGTVRADVKSSGVAVADIAGNYVTGGFTSGQTYTIDPSAPTVSSIVRAGSNPTTGVSVDYTVTFSEAVTGVDTADFTVTHTGSANGTVATVTPVSGSVYTVTVNSIVGNGTLRLDLNGSGTGIADTATNAISTGFTSGETYTVTESIDARVSISANSGAGIDGGNTNTYTITVVNNGPTNASNLGIGFTAPAELAVVGTWSCVASAGTTCPNASGTYPIAETATTLEVGESLTYLVVGTVDDEATSTSITATATITPSNLQHDLSHADDTATRTDAIGVYANGFEDN